MTSEIAVGLLVVVAALALRVAWAERQKPGSGLAQWRFLADGKAVVAGSLVFVGMTAAVFMTGTPKGAVMWALLAGLLTALIVYQVTHGRPRP
ncbi:hypothetical protein ABZ330_20345 [Streptomyces sp. NPDC006172]|uniref:hypothetical protein n=1 Tax=Streptomyces sp. NPDC006172 TaxID=3154470 RepID=UPI003406D53C